MFFAKLVFLRTFAYVTNVTAVVFSLWYTSPERTRREMLECVSKI